jgi:hypothetical protein
MLHSTSPIGTDIQDGGYELPRIPLPRRRVNKACGRPDRTGTAGEGMHTSSGIMRQRVLGGERAKGIGTGRSEESEPLEGVL